MEDFNDVLLSSLPEEQLTSSRRQLLSYLKRGISRPERIEVLALARLGAKNAVLVLTNERLGFAWELGFSPTRRFLDRSSIVSAELEGGDLVVRDADRPWRYKGVWPLQHAAAIVDQLSQTGPAATRTGRSTPTAPRSGPLRGLRRLAAIGISCFALFLLIGLIANIFGIR